MESPKNTKSQDTFIQIQVENRRRDQKLEEETAVRPPDLRVAQEPQERRDSIMEEEQV